MRKFTISTVTSPTFVAPNCLRKDLIRSCSTGIFSAITFLKSVDSADNERRAIAVDNF